MFVRNTYHALLFPIPIPRHFIVNVQLVVWGISASESKRKRPAVEWVKLVLLAIYSLMSRFSGIARLPWFKSKLGALSCEARTAEARRPKGWSTAQVGFLEAAASSLPTSYSGPGERCKLSQWDLGEAPAAKIFDTFCVLKWPLLLWKIVCALCKRIISLIFVTHVTAIIAQELGTRFIEPPEPQVSTPMTESITVSFLLTVLVITVITQRQRSV